MDSLSDLQAKRDLQETADAEERNAEILEASMNPEEKVSQTTEPMEVDSDTATADTAEEAVEQVAETAESAITTTEVTEKGVTRKIIAAPNPTAEEMEVLLKDIKVNYDSNVVTKPVQYNFKKSTDKETGIETVRNAVQLAIPYPSIEGLITILQKGGKQLELLQEAVEKVVNDAVRELLYENVTLTAATFPVNKISWEAISNQPKAQRRGGGIPKETWEGFSADYIAVMPEVTGKSIEQTSNAAKILTNKLTQVKTNKPVLELLIGQLAIYAEASENIGDYQECVAFLVEKADTLLNASDEDLLGNL